MSKPKQIEDDMTWKIRAGKAFFYSVFMEEVDVC